MYVCMQLFYLNLFLCVCCIAILFLKEINSIYSAQQFFHRVVRPDWPLQNEDLGDGKGEHALRKLYSNLSPEYRQGPSNTGHYISRAWVQKVQQSRLYVERSIYIYILHFSLLIFKNIYITYFDVFRYVI